MSKRRQSPYYNTIYHWDVLQGKIGTKVGSGPDKGMNEIYWEVQDGKIYIVCPHCRKILHIPDWLIQNGEITCMLCTQCKADYSYTLEGWKKPNP
jgi:hypothetical protein